jgi:PAS domain S-box-containing protein
MPSLKVAHRLLLGSLLIAALAGGLGWLTLVASGWQADRIESLRVTSIEATDHAAALALAARTAHGGAQTLLVQRTLPTTAEAPADRSGEQVARAAVAEGLTAFERHLARSHELAAAEGRAASERVGALESAFASYKQAITRFVEMSAGGSASSEPAVAVAFFDGEVRPPFEEALAPLAARHLAATQAAVAERVAAAESAGRWRTVFGFGGALLLLVVSLVVGGLTARHVDRGLGRTVNAARAIAAGRLTNPVRVASDDEFGDLAEALNDMVARLSTATVSKTYVENIVQSMADPLVVVDPEVRIAMVNQALLDLLGYEANELTGASVIRIFAHTGRQRGAAIKQDIERGLAGNVDSRFRTKAGQEVTVSLSSALVRAGGEVQGLVIVAKDITEQKRREKELIDAKDEAERMVQLRDAFLANMSHEIRTPLTGILGSAQVLAEVVEGEHRNLARIIEDAGNRLLDTINSVLEMARIEAGEVQPEMEILDFAQEAEAVVSVLRPVAEKKGLALRVHPPLRGRVAAQLDRTCLNRILNNLIGNAIKFTREGSVSVEISVDGDDAILTIRDTGIGIAKEFLPFLFDDFKQESTGLERSHEGTGLGLAITRKLVDMMGGTISVDSVKGLGSAFMVRFERVPMEEAAAFLPPPSSAAARLPHGLGADAALAIPTFEPPPPAADRIARDLLLIEDNQQNAYMAKFMLEGFSADVATSPEEAMDLVRRFQYGVLLVDINLGTDSSGIDLLHDIRQVDGYETTPAVAVTAYALPGDRERFLQEGFDDYVSKPYRKETLRDAVDRALASATPVQPIEDLDAVLGGSFEEDADAAPLAEPDAPADAPLASPDEFLPPTYRPPQPAFSREAAEVVERAAQADEQDASSEGLMPLPNDDAFLFVDLDAPGAPGHGAGRPPAAPGR